MSGLPAEMPTETSGARRRYPSLVVTGIVMLSGVFLYANPYFGSKAARWPWEHLVEAASLSRKADFLLWVGCAVFSIVVGLGYGGRRRLAWLAAPVLLLVARCYGESAAFTAVRPNEPTLAWFVAVACLGAALSVHAKGEPPPRSAARALGAVGAIGVAAAYAITFRGARSVVWHMRQDYANAWEKLFGGSETDPAFATKMWAAWWGTLVPMGLLVLAAGTAFVLSSVRDATKWTRLAARIAWILLLGRWLAPVFATMWMERDRFAGGSDVALLAEWTGRTIFDAGLGLWLLASFTIAAVVRELSSAPVSVGAAPLGTAS